MSVSKWLPLGVWVHHRVFIGHARRLNGGSTHRRRLDLSKFERCHDVWERLWRRRP
jgi:hypothetical protein